MSTRSKARLAAAATSKESPTTSVKPVQKSKTRSKTTKSAKSESDQLEKENVKVKVSQRASKSSSTKKGSSKTPPPTYCICNQGDDGSPMVLCGNCNICCVNLSEEDAEEINVYICPACTTTTGLRTAMIWEGPSAIENTPVDAQTKIPKKQSVEPRPKRPTPVHLPSESEEEPSSEDEYIADKSKSKGNTGRRQTHRLSISTETDSDVSDNAKSSRRTHTRKASSSPAPGHHRLKRKNEHASNTPPPKRKKSDTTPADDPARKYCLGKLEEVFRDIFLRYPHVHAGNQGNANNSNAEKLELVPKALDQLTEKEKEVLQQESANFATELENCVFEIYSEPDKHGNPSAGSKYKDRFRMLQFNLSKVDRVVIHRRIASSQITPKEISVMSSTDLANEETKQSIKIAEKEALEYSILTPTAIPRAKITHKGLEDIEDVHGDATSVQEQEQARIEEEEKRERERMARLRTQKRQRTASASIPPESPSVHQGDITWGAPPPVPSYAVSPTNEPSSPTVFGHERPQILPQVVPESSLSEPELNLADFINMDDEVPIAADHAPDPARPLQPSNQQSTPDAALQTPVLRISPISPTAPTGISPFAAKPETPSSGSFNLDTLWTASSQQDNSPPAAPSTEIEPDQQLSPIPMPSEEVKDIVMDSDTMEADDQDFDMFLEEKETTSVESLQASFDALPQVWSGKINMPLDSTIPQETPVIARQMGGRHLDHNSDLWKTLFPSDLLRIDGRVPVDNSCKFLLQMRMNATKELIAVAFSPTSESNDIGFRILSDFLIAKGRHGLVFPWGNRPKDYHPGRELYIIPLISSDPLPDYMELLDDLRLPKLRKSNYLVGIWILNKGKLAPPPPPAPPAIPQIPANIHLPMLSAPPSIPSATATNSQSLPLPAAIAAEVASLTPEQIQLMIRTLSSNGAIPLPISTQPPAQPLVNQPPAPQPHMAIPHPAPSQPWSNSNNYGGGYHPPPPPNPPLAHPPPPPPPPPHRTPPHGQSPYERHDYANPRGQGYDRGGRGGDRGGDRGWRGRGRGRGRAGDGSSKPLDSGWPRRPRNDSGGPGPSSPGRRW